jgi:hypothetical protein
LDSSSLQWAADCWTVTRFLDALFTDSTEKVTVINAASVKPGHTINFEVHGRCYQKQPCVFRYELDPKELTEAQKIRLRDSVLKVIYAKEKQLKYPTARRICKALEVPFT